MHGGHTRYVSLICQMHVPLELLPLILLVCNCVQDDEYLASLQADREKEIKAMEEAEIRRLEEQAAREAALAEERRKEEESRKKLEEEQVICIFNLLIPLH